MICILPFMGQRTTFAWLLLMAASLATLSPAPWWLIDAAGAVVFASWPQWQSRLIAMTFFVMMLADLGANPWPIGMALGWIQLIALLMWATGGLQQNPMRGVPTI